MARAFRSALGAGAGKIAWDVASRSLSFALSILVARSLGAAGYGSYAVFWYSAWMLSQLTDLGLHLVSLRSLSADFQARVFWSASAAKAALSAAVLLGTLVLGSPLLLLLLAAHVFGSWVEFLGVTLRSRRLIAREGILLTTLRFGWLAGALWALSRGAGLEALARAMALASLPALVLAALLVAPAVRGSFSQASRSEVRGLLTAALPLAVTSAITMVYLRADLLILAALSGQSEAGLFQSAFRVFEATFVLSGGIAAGTFPFLAARFVRSSLEEREDFRALARFVLGLLLLVGVPLGVGLALFSETVIGLLYGAGYRDASRPLAFLGLAVVAVFANALTTHVLVASRRNLRLVGSMLARLAVGCGLDFLLVPLWGATGAAISVAAAEWSLLAITLVCVSDLLGLSWKPRRSATREEASSCS
jgi:O-antigen/teichoic acid export membrane protein